MPTRTGSPSKSSTENSAVFFLLGVLLVLPGAAWAGFVVKTLWGWFVVPLGVIPLSLWHAAGITLLIRVFLYPAFPNLDKERSAAERFMGSVFTLALIPAVALAFGAIYHAFS